MSTVLKIGVIIGYIAIISFIATYLGKGTKTFKDFAIGGSKIPWYIMGGTLFSTFCGLRRKLLLAGIDLDLDSHSGRPRRRHLSVPVQKSL